MVDWISLSQTAGTAGTVSVTLTASNNTELVERTTALTVKAANKSAVIAVSQERNHLLELSPTTYVYSSRGGYFLLVINTDDEWSLEGPNWLTYSQTSGSGNTNVTVTAGANETEVQKSGRIVVTNSVTSAATQVVQLEMSDSEPIYISPSAITTTSAGEATWITITTDYPWTLTLPDWISANETSGVGTAGVYIWPSENYRGARTGVIIAKTSTDSAACIYKQDGIPKDYSSPLGFEILTSGTLIWNAWSDAPRGGAIEYSRDGGTTWNTLQYRLRLNYRPEDGLLNVYAGETILVRGNSSSYWGMSFGGTAVFNLKGNIMSLFNPTNFENLTTIEKDEVFISLFEGTHVVDASMLILPATVMTKKCYANMFYACTNLIAAPELPATTLAESCYSGMFANCLNLKTAPDLPATVLKKYCYWHMFYVPNNDVGHVTFINCSASTWDVWDSAWDIPSWCVGDWVGIWGGYTTSEGVFIGNGEFPWIGEGYPSAERQSGIPLGWLFINTSS